MNPQLILLGAPGSGKGTQAKKLIDKEGYNHISTGDLLRNEIAKGSELGKKVEGILSSGKLVDTQTVLELLKANCDLANAHYIFDGFPRNLDQAQLLDSEVLKDAKTMAVYFDIDLDLLKDRIVNRRTCGDCGEIYNLLSKAPKKEGVCDKCGGTKLNQRKDDNEDTVRERLAVFKKEFDPILAYYQEKGILKRINANQESDGVLDELLGTLK